jgi:hypothetical protein
MRRRFLQPLVLVIAVLAVVAVFVAPAVRARLLVDFVTGLAWPLVLAAVVVAFWPQLNIIAEEIGSRVLRGAAVQLGGVVSVSSLPEQAAQIPSPSAAAPVGLENIALLHTSFLRPDKTRQFDDEDRSSRFKLKELANGTSIVRARVDIRGQDQPLLLNRFIDLRPDGPRI